jgi:hypothetical protein
VNSLVDRWSPGSQSGRTAAIVGSILQLVAGLPSRDKVLVIEDVNFTGDNYLSFSFQQLTFSVVWAHVIFIMGVGMSIRHARGCSAARVV